MPVRSRTAAYFLEMAVQFMSGLNGKVALVTGGSSGIGREACLALARAGCKVAVHYRTGRERALAVVDRIAAAGGEAVALGADLASTGEIRGLPAAVKERWGRLDILVNNAGDPIRRVPFAEVDDALLDMAFAVNLKGPFVLCQAAVPLLAESRGVIVNVSTSMTFKGSNGDNTHYTTIKGGINVLTICLAKELSPLGIRVNCLCPSAVDTELQQRLSTPERLKKSAERSLLKRVASPQEIAESILFLASDASSYINGQVIVADGGRA